jgi:hypothetical protein
MEQSTDHKVYRTPSKVLAATNIPVCIIDCVSPTLRANVDLPQIYALQPNRAPSPPDLRSNVIPVQFADPVQAQSAAAAVRLPCSNLEFPSSPV